METKITRSTNVVISLDGDEAAQLFAVVATFPRGVAPISDKLYDDLSSFRSESEATRDSIDEWLDGRVSL